MIETDIDTAKTVDGSIAAVEHLNVTVADPLKTAKMLIRLFGWHIRWQGKAKDDGFTVHVGSPDAEGGSYLALYRRADSQASSEESYGVIGGLNHIGVVVGDLEAAEARVTALGFTPYNHGDYEPGRRFYFDDADGIEFEVISYA